MFIVYFYEFLLALGGVLLALCIVVPIVYIVVGPGNCDLLQGWFFSLFGGRKIRRF